MSVGVFVLCLVLFGLVTVVGYYVSLRAWNLLDFFVGVAFVSFVIPVIVMGFLLVWFTTPVMFAICLGYIVGTGIGLAANPASPYSDQPA